MSEERVVVGRAVLRVPSPERFFTTLSPIQQREIEEAVRDQLSAELLEVSKSVERILEGLLLDVSASPAMVVHPDFDRVSVYDRIARLFSKAGMILEKSVSSLRSVLESGTASEGEVEVGIARFLATLRVTLLALRESMARVLAVYNSNLPAELRPPIANVVLGFDQLAPR